MIETQTQGSPNENIVDNNPISPDLLENTSQIKQNTHTTERAPLVSKNLITRAQNNHLTTQPSKNTNRFSPTGLLLESNPPNGETLAIQTTQLIETVEK